MFDGDDMAAVYLSQTERAAYPTHFLMTDVTINTNQAYRIQFPGRPTIAADNRDYPPDPIDLDGMFFNRVSEVFPYIGESF